jgi:hypothetical protein
MASAAPFGVRAQAEGAVENNIFGGSQYEREKGTDEKGEDKTHEFSVDSSEDGEKVHDLVREFTQRSIKNDKGEHINPFEGAENPLLDPTSEKFSYKTWVKNLLGVQSRDPDRYPARVAGVAYTGLSCHGFGEATDYQKTFGNYPLEFPSLLRRMVGKRQQRKIQILRDFDGLIRSGEMLVVLGRPGSYVSPSSLDIA